MKVGDVMLKTDVDLIALLILIIWSSIYKLNIFKHESN